MRNATLKLVTPPTFEPVSVSQLKSHCRITQDDEDTDIEGFILAARTYIETRIGFQMALATWMITLPSFPDCDEIQIPLFPLQSIDFVNYYGSTGNLTTLSTSLYQTDIDSAPGRVILIPQNPWPLTSRKRTNNVVIQFTAGLTVDDTQDPRALLALKLLAAHWFENREDSTDIQLRSIPRGVDTLIGNLSNGVYH